MHTTAWNHTGNTNCKNYNNKHSTSKDSENHIWDTLKPPIEPSDLFSPTTATHAPGGSISPSLPMRTNCNHAAWAEWWVLSCLDQWGERGSTIYKPTHAPLCLVEWPKWLTRLSHSGTTVLFQRLYTSKSLSQAFSSDVYLSKHSDQKVRFHTLGQTVC